MRSAFKTNPRNSAIAVRLAKSLEARGDVAAAKSTIQTGLDNNPGNKRLHYALAHFLMRHEDGVVAQIEYHLQRSFTKGDANYDAQLLYARQLYAKGDIPGAKECFRLLAAAKVGPDVRGRMLYPFEEWFTGRVARLEATYCFVVRDGIGDSVFAHRSRDGVADLDKTRGWLKGEVSNRIHDERAGRAQPVHGGRRYRGE